jgi:hypothetical protein
LSFATMVVDLPSTVRASVQSGAVPLKQSQDRTGKGSTEHNYRVCSQARITESSLRSTYSPAITGG